MNHKTSLAACFLGILFLAPSAFAEESQFAYVSTTDLLPKNQKEIQHWTTWAAKQSNGSFNLWENRTGIQYGVTDAFQFSLYANYLSARVSHNDENGRTAAPKAFTKLNINPNNPFNDAKFSGVSAQGIYRLMSPYKDPIGFAVLFEPTLGNDLYQMESRAIFQKNFLDDTLIFAANATLKQNARRTDHWDRSTDLNFGLAVSYRFMRNWSGGFEFQHEKSFAGFGEFEETASVYYLGPSLHYGGEKFFLTLTFLTQMDWDDNYSGDFSKYRLRFKSGYYF